MTIKKAILLDAGDRGGRVYANLIKSLPNKIQLVGVAEPVLERRERIKGNYELDDNLVQ